MNSRQRVIAAMKRQSPDKVPVEFYYTPVGYYEHGDKLNDLFATLPGDFAPFVRKPVPLIGKELFDFEGKYHELKKDEWGTVWEYRIFGIAGIPKVRPLDDISRLASFELPIPPSTGGADFLTARAAADKHKTEYFLAYNCGNLLEKLLALRNDADVYCDMLEGTREINLLADRIAGYDRARVEYAVALGADSVTFGDDYGTERAMLFSPELWRSFIKPRLKYIFEPAVKAGLFVQFHSCGMIEPIIPDLMEIGATSIWPQLPAYDMKKLAGLCRSLGLSIAIHTDRANTMTFGTPSQVRDLVLREYETFELQNGGGWFYIEADNGFPYANLEALVNTVAELRGER